jgi:hypothetical protein
MKTPLAGAVFALCCVAAADAQQPTSAAAQITAAVAPLPQEFRESASVLGYQAGKAGLTRLRAGDGAFTCLADDPGEPRFHVACYHNSLEPFMARGRQLRAQGITGNGVDSVRFAEIGSGKLAMPTSPAALYSITLPPDRAGEVNAETGAVPATAKPLYVVYISNATSESTGLPKAPAAGMPWIMFPGTPKAHIMFVPSMQ